MLFPPPELSYLAGQGHVAIVRKTGSRKGMKDFVGQTDILKLLFL